MKLCDLTNEDLLRYRNLIKIGSKRQLEARTYQMDTKFGYHVVRLVLEVEQILTEGDLDLERHRELLKDIRRGNWSFERVKDWFSSKEKQLDEIYHKSELPYKPDEIKIKALLLECLEEHFGNLESVIAIEDKAVKTVREISEIIEKYNRMN